MAVDVPLVVRNKAVAAGADAWLAGLGDLLAALADDWGIVVGSPYTGGTEAYVAEARTADGRPAVLKLCIPRDIDAARQEALVLALAGGEGCAELLRADVARGALLVERLGPSLADEEVPLVDRLPLLVAAAARVWRPAPDVDLPTGADKGRALAEHVVQTWEETGRPCSEAAVAQAVACAERRAAAHDDERAVLVHGDVHQWNALWTLDGTSVKLVDPDGLRCEPEYDLGVLMREDPDTPVALWDRAVWLAERTGLDVTAIWEWGVAERVATGLLCERIDLQPVGRQMLASADAIAAPDRPPAERPGRA